MAQISTNIEQLMKAPSLKEAEGQEPELFLSRSRPVAAKAKHAHLTTLKHMQAPWWKKLTMETPDLSQNARPSSISGSPQIFFRNTSSRWTPPLLHSLESIGCFFEEAEHFLTLIGFRRC